MSQHDSKTRRLSAAMLFLAATMELVGFSLCFLEGFVTFCGRLKTNFLGERYPSGNNYWPLTVSEMTHDPLKPEGAVFRAFALAVAMCLFTSAYPWNLSNVYLGGVTRHAQFFMLTRHMAPPLGLVILSQTPVTPGKQSTIAQLMNVYVHLLGAFCMFGGYLFVEGYTLFVATPRQICPRGRFWRMACEITMIALAPTFLVLSYLADDSIIDATGICCSNKYRVPTMADLAQLRAAVHANPGSHMEAYLHMALEARRIELPLLVDTSKGWALTLRAATYITESLLGFVMSASMLVIWWNCRERHVRLAPELPELANPEEEGSSCSESAEEVGSAEDSALGVKA